MFKEYTLKDIDEYINYYFDDNLIIRGIEYYNSNLVKDLVKLDDKYIAVVYGSDQYIVNIDMSDDKEDGIIIGTDCTCLYAQSGSACKHEVAALLYLKNLVVNITSEENQEEITNLIENIPINKLKNYLKDMAILNFNVYKDLKRL